MLYSRKALKILFCLSGTGAPSGSLLLLPATNAENAVGLAERISKSVEKNSYAYENETLSVTLTLGVSIIRSEDTVASIIKKADIVMYQGKKVGRNCVICFDSKVAMKIPGEA